MQILFILPIVPFSLRHAIKELTYLYTWKYVCLFLYPLINPPIHCDAALISLSCSQKIQICNNI